MINKELDEIEARARAALAFDVSEDEYDDSEETGCPLCDGIGYVEHRIFDAKKEAATVIAYGIGKDYLRAQAWVTSAPQDILKLVAELRRAQLQMDRDLAFGRPDSRVVETEADKAHEYDVLTRAARAFGFDSIEHAMCHTEKSDAFEQIAKTVTPKWQEVRDVTDAVDALAAEVQWLKARVALLEDELDAADEEIQTR